MTNSKYARSGSGAMSGNAALQHGSRYSRGEPLAAERVLKSALKKFGIDRHLARYQFVLHWKEIVGDQIAQRTAPECIKNQILVVRVVDSSWAQELSFQKNIILHRLRRFLDDKEIVNDVIFYVVGKEVPHL